MYLAAAILPCVRLAGLVFCIEDSDACSAGQPANLGMHVILVHGDEVIADSEKAGSIQAATAQYKQWLNKTFPSQ